MIYSSILSTFFSLLIETIPDFLIFIIIHKYFSRKSADAKLFILKRKQKNLHQIEVKRLCNVMYCLK